MIKSTIFYFMTIYSVLTFSGGKKTFLTIFQQKKINKCSFFKSKIYFSIEKLYVKTGEKIFIDLN